MFLLQWAYQKFKKNWLEYEHIFLHKSHRLSGYDGLRFFSILLIVIYHVLLETVKLNIVSMTDVVFLRSLFVLSLYCLFLGSGFLIFLLLLRSKEKYGRYDLKKFWFRRILRTWPVYFLVLGIYVITDKAVDPSALPFYMTYTQNFIMAQHNFFVTSWTIAVEEQFYLIAPLILVFFTRLNIGILTLFLALVAGCIRYFVPQTLFSGQLTIFWVDGFICGLYLAHAHIQNNRAVRLALLWPNCTSLLGVTLFYLLAHGHNYFGPFNTFVAFVFVTFAFYPIQSPQHVLNRFLSKKTFYFLAAISYSMYLVHEIIIKYFTAWWGEYLFHLPYGLGVILPLFIVISLVIAASTFLFFFIEMPVYKWRERYFQK